MNIERIQKELIEHEERKRIRDAEARKRKASAESTENPWSGKNRRKLTIESSRSMFDPVWRFTYKF